MSVQSSHTRDDNDDRTREEFDERKYFQVLAEHISVIRDARSGNDVCLKTEFPDQLQVPIPRQAIERLTLSTDVAN